MISTFLRRVQVFAPVLTACGVLETLEAQTLRPTPTLVEGDMVYVPANTWHATRFFGPDPACRLSITEYVGNTLLLEPRPPR